MYFFNRVLLTLKLTKLIKILFISNNENETYTLNTPLENI